MAECLSKPVMETDEKNLITSNILIIETYVLD